MNAYTPISHKRRRALSKKLRSRSFRVGIREGFAAPLLFWCPMEFKFSDSVDATVMGAWKAVGDAIKTSSSTKKGVKVGEAAREGKVTREIESA